MSKALVFIFGMLVLCGTIWAAGNSESFTREVPYNNERLVNLKLDFGMGALSIARTSGNFVAKIQGDYDSRKFTVKFDYSKDGDKGTLALKVEQKKSHFGSLFGGEDERNGDNHWQILLGDMVPFDLGLDVGMAEIDLDFTDLQIAGIDLDLGMGSGTMAFDKPNPVRMNKFVMDVGSSSLSCTGLGNANFTRLTMDCGMGSVKLGFSGQGASDGKVSLNIGMGSMDVELNPEMGTRISYEDNLTSSVNFPEDNFNRVGKNTVESDNYDHAGGHLDFDIDVGMGGIDFGFAQSL